MTDLNIAIKKSFGEKFKLARMAAGYSRAKLGIEISVSAKTIQSWEVGRTFPENMALIPVIRNKLGFFIPTILGQTVEEEEVKASGSVEKKIVRRAAVVDGSFVVKVPIEEEAKEPTEEEVKEPTEEEVDDLAE